MPVADAGAYAIFNPVSEERWARASVFKIVGLATDCLFREDYESVKLSLAAITYAGLFFRMSFRYFIIKVAADCYI